MSIQLAEQLKREWTDRHVMVLDGVPELRRFQGLVGQVKTVNMNCRLLIEFDCPADISWYDVDPQFVTVVDAAQLAAAAAAEQKSATAAANSPAVQPAAKKTSADRTSAAPAGGSPLDAIRAGSSGTAANSPLDQIRGAAAKKAEPAPGPAVGGSPLDQIRASAAGPQAASDSAAQATPTRTGDSPLDQIRAQSASSQSGSVQADKGTAVDDGADASAENKPSATTSGTSPLDQIRAQSSSGGDVQAESAEGPKSKTTGSKTTESKPKAVTPTESAAPAPAPPQPDTAPASDAQAASPNRAAMAETADERKDADNLATQTPVTAVASAQTLPGETETALQQVHAQASDGEEDTPVPGSRFAQVSQQAQQVPENAPVERSSDKSASPSPDVPTVQPTTDQPAAKQPPRTAWPVKRAVRERRRSASSRPRTSTMQQRTLQHRRGVRPARRTGPRSPHSARSAAGRQPKPVIAATDAAAGVEDPVKQTFHGRKLPQLDDLKIVEGIGPKIEELIHAAGITTWAALAATEAALLQQILADAGPRFQMHNPTTWPAQAALAQAGKWQQLEELQDQLDGGKPPE